jgi:heparosan-N-sulfate-glucuronate 5-epimerase
VEESQSHLFSSLYESPSLTIKQRLNYYRRLIPAYLGRQKSQLTFWYETPEVNERCEPRKLGEYYMPFTVKANYLGAYDRAGIPLLDYRGKLGLQYNPIAIAQYGLGNYNLFLRTGNPERREKCLAVADWLVTNLQQNSAGLWVWNHYFDWEYRTTLKAPWYSALAQGQGISILLRAHLETGRTAYLDAAQRAFASFLNTVDQGGVVYVDDNNHTWFEEYIVSPPTHILNGFIWASWGVYDYFLATGDSRAQHLFDQAVRTLTANLSRFDVGFWSLYEQSGTWLRMLASPFYHQLHIVQLEILSRLTGEKIFYEYAARWEGYFRSRPKRTAALGYKIVFKLCCY